MEKTQCDKCKKVIESEDIHYIVFIVKVGQDDPVKEVIDLCDACTIATAAFMKGL